MTEESLRHVFVYGTLRHGEANDITRLEPTPRFVGVAIARGQLFQLGWYPGLLLGGEEPVVGEVYEITAPLERLLDEIEEVQPTPSSEYFKREVTLQVNSVDIRCIVYEINEQRLSGKDRILSGDWKKRSAV